MVGESDPVTLSVSPYQEEIMSLDHSQQLSRHYNQSQQPPRDSGQQGFEPARSGVRTQAEKSGYSAFVL